MTSKRAALVGAVLAAAVALTGCQPRPVARSASPAPATVDPGPAEFAPIETSDVFDRALRTDLCALFDEAALAADGLTVDRDQVPQDHTGCDASDAEPDLALKHVVIVRFQPTESQLGPQPARDGVCDRDELIEESPRTKLVVEVRDKRAGDPCEQAQAYLATAVERFGAGVATVDPALPWTALDACVLLESVLPVSTETFGPAVPWNSDLRRPFLRTCQASHENGDAQVSVDPSDRGAADIDGDEIVIGTRTGRIDPTEKECYVSIVGETVGDAPRDATDVIEVRVTAEDVDQQARCAAATAMAEKIAADL